MTEKDVENILDKYNLKPENILVGTIDEMGKFVYQLKEEQK